MSVSPGQKLGPYEIVDAIGAGGMGEVYRARDPRLGRDVAVKVLPASLSADADRLHRFEQEARAAAALNHPNILAVYDIGAFESAPYIVSELLEGETLRIPPSGLPIRKAIDHAVQIARGLAAAHDKGIVHRDLKPQNIFVTTDSRVKILDFGLAKLTQTESSVEAPTVLPTSPAINTQAGMVLGTMGYMAPEQVRGLAVDHRADIFAFGVVLYEMLSGRRAFQGSTAADTMIAIVKEDPADLPLAERHISPALERIVDRCLEKSPAARFQTAADLAFALESLSAHSDRTEIGRAPLPAAPGRLRAWLPWAVAAILGLSLVGVSVLHFLERAPAVQPVHFQVRLPDDAAPTGQAPIEISPDGERVVFGATSGGVLTLWHRPLGSLEARQLPGTDGAAFPFWSPDSRSIGFFANGKLYRMQIAGGPAVIVCDAPGSAGGAWNRDNVIVFGTSEGVLRKVASAGGSPVDISKLEGEERGHRWPFFLPDGRHFLYTGVTSNNAAGGRLFVGTLDSGDRRSIGPFDSNAVYGAGYLLFAQNQTLMAQSFDAERQQLSGEPFPIAEQVSPFASTRKMPASISDSGTLAYRRGGSLAKLTWFDRGGRVLSTVGARALYVNLNLSPDERRVAVSLAAGSPRNIDIWLIDFDRPASPTRITSDPSGEFDPAWTPDGSHVVFTSTRTGAYDLYRHAANGSGQDDLLMSVPAGVGSPEYSRDNKFLIFTSGPDIWFQPLTKDAKPSVWMKSAFTEGDPVLSPNGHWVAYHSNESGQPQVYVQAFPGGGSKQRISEANGVEPRWDGNGRELFFIAAGGTLMAASIDTSNGFRASPPVPLFQTRMASSQNNHPYAVTKDGKRFLVIAGDEQELAQMTVVVNWPATVQK